RLWGAARIHGELLMLGFEVAQSTGLEIYGATFEAAVAKLEDVSAKSRTGITYRIFRTFRIDGFF
ncbi:MAG: hypothetical protein WA704_04985, partial [Pseudolabrys sp.]